MSEAETAVAPSILSPDEKVFQAHLAGGNFRSGEYKGRWRKIAVVWPHATIAVSAAARGDAPSEFVFRFDYENYPNDAPTACLWDTEKNVALPKDRWPIGTDRFALAFKYEWKNGQAIYLPCDRLALPGHDTWRQQHPDMIWTPQQDITFYLRILYDYLNSRHYQGVSGPTV